MPTKLRFGKSTRELDLEPVNDLWLWTDDDECGSGNEGRTQRDRLSQKEDLEDQTGKQGEE